MQLSRSQQLSASFAERFPKAAVASAGSPTVAEIRSKLIDKIRHHGYKQLEIWVSDYDYTLEALSGFVPAENQIGRNLEIATGGATNDRMRQLSPWEGLVGLGWTESLLLLFCMFNDDVLDC